MRCGDRCWRRDGGAGLDRLACARGVRRLHAPPEHDRLPRELPPRGHHHRAVSRRSAHPRPPPRPCGVSRRSQSPRTSATRTSDRVACGSMPDHCCSSRGSSRTTSRPCEPTVCGSPKLASVPSTAPRTTSSSSLWPRQAGLDDDAAHRRLLDPRDVPSHRRGRARHQSRHLVPHQRRPGRHRRPLLRRDCPDRRWACRSALRATCAPASSPPKQPIATTPSTACSSAPTRPPAAGSCRSGCSTRSSTWRQ